MDCGSVAGGFACEFTLDAAQGVHVYGGRVVLSDGNTVSARAEYRFTVLSAVPANALVEVRVPEGKPASFADTLRVDLAWTHDPQGYTDAQFIADAADATFKGILADPVYRWRDRHLGFFVHTRPAFVESYYIGRDTRCGKNPWPSEAAWPTELANVAALGVLHRKTTSSAGIEGSGVAQGNVPFRDCAGHAVKRLEVGTFSANAAIAAFTTIAKHEFGHAAFGHGDEYTETTATRNVVPALVMADECCCKVESGTVTQPGGTVTTPGGTTTTTTGGATGTGGGSTTPGTPGGGFPGITFVSKRCVPAGGGPPATTQGPDTGLPACGGALATHCGASPDGGCPGLAGDCVRSTSWLGASAPASPSAQRPNVFPSEQACLVGLQRASAHPAVEDPARSLGTCRQLCGASMAPCPCTGGDAWIVDIDPRPTAAATTDAMGVVSAAGEQLGGTCQWCVETSLCVRWHAPGRRCSQGMAACDAPPKNATLLEQLWNALVAWINQIVAWILNQARF